MLIDDQFQGLIAVRITEAESAIADEGATKRAEMNRIGGFHAPPPDLYGKWQLNARDFTFSGIKSSIAIVIDEFAYSASPALLAASIVCEGAEGYPSAQADCILTCAVDQQMQVAIATEQALFSEHIAQAR